MLAGQRVAIYLDAGAYPIAQWGVERAAARGVPVRSFPHHDAKALERQILKDAPREWLPLVVADGFCPSCGQSAPLADYLKIVRIWGGNLILDDTQALGILGSAAGPNAPYGRGGGGSLRWNRIGGPDVLLISSMAKGFGVPMAVLSGSDEMVRRFEVGSETRVHTSPPSIAVVRAAEHALEVNSHRGDVLRFRLAQLVRRFRRRLKDAGFSARGGLFPVQTLVTHEDVDAAELHRRMSREGLRCVLHHPRNGYRAQISFLITARHCPEEIDHAVVVLAQTAGVSIEETRSEVKNEKPMWSMWREGW
jgi:8-amino-7-oxononanoate synthase